MVKIVDSRLKVNLALVDVLPAKKIEEFLNAYVVSGRDDLTQGLTVPQVGADYSIVRVQNMTEQNFELEGCETQLPVFIGHYYIISAARISLIGNVVTNTPQAFVNTTDLLVELNLEESNG